MRLLKQCVYGALYLILIGGVGAWAYGRLTAVPPTCADGVQNQHEDAVDCGGECASCETREQTIQTLGTPGVFALGDRYATAAVRVRNPSAQFWLPRVRYTFILLDAFGVVAAAPSGATTLGPGEEKYLTASVVSLDARDVGRVEVTFDNLFWERALRYLPLDLRAEVTSYTPSGELVRIDGTILNSSRVTAPSSRVGIFLVGRDGEKKSLVLADVGPVAPFSSEPFDVLAPISAYAESDLGRTETFVDRRE